MRLRKTDSIRVMLKETRLSVKNLIAPLFVKEGNNIKSPIKHFPNVFYLSVDRIISEVGELNDLGIPAILLFGICSNKDENGSQAWAKNGVVQKAIMEIKKKFSKIVVITDVCLCGYRLDGHCGVFKNNKLDLPLTLEYLSKIALSHAQAGCDFVAPSAMMDGQVKAIRETLDKNQFGDVGILAYSAKFASGFYGPFREALDSSPKFGDRKSYQLDYANKSIALKKIEQDIYDGADIVMVKPALCYLDIIKEVKQKFNVPIAAYNVSGEYSIIKFASEKKLIDEKDTVIEILTAIKRAGADLIITYHAKDVAKWLKE